ncbi:hypothetical protein [Streptomyces sp. NPDC002779]|uniref:hypothetical protein n=1 Tax=Streptomyces sp. NPDC002779 TaxID=3364664 RepID=UPI0036CCFFB4
MFTRLRALLGVLAAALLLGLTVGAAPVQADPANTATVQDPTGTFGLSVTPASASVGDTVYVTLDYTNKGSATVQTNFGYTGSPVGSYAIGAPTGDTAVCGGPLIVEGGCTYLLVPGGDSRRATWPGQSFYFLPPLVLCVH